MDAASALIGSFHELLDEATNLPFACLSTDEASRWLVDLEAVQRRLAALVCRSFTATTPAAAEAADSGHRSTADMVAARTGANPAGVRSDAKLAVWLLDHPDLADAFTRGLLSKEHVRAIRARENGRTRAHLPAAESYLIEAAQSCQWAEFMAALRYWELAADPDGAEPSDQRDDRSFQYAKRADGSVTGRFTLDPLAGQAALDAVECHVQRLFRADAESGSLRTATQRRADALVDVLSGCSGAGPDALVHVVVSEAVVADHVDRLACAGKDARPLPLDPHDSVDGRCELIDGTPLHPSFAWAAFAKATFRRFVLDPESEITDLGREARCFPPHLKRALLIKARGRCQHPGCDAPVAWLQADHLTPWSQGGTTDLANGQILCDPHNKLKRDRSPPRPPALE